MTKAHACALAWYNARRLRDVDQCIALSEAVKDFVQAHMWFNLAAAQGYKPGDEGRDGIAEFMTPAEVAEAQRLAGKWRPSGQ